MTQSPWTPPNRSNARHGLPATTSSLPPTPRPDYVGPSWRISVALSFVFGSFGVADFYMGRWLKGLFMLMLSPFGISTFIAIAQAIYWLSRGEEWFQRAYGDVEPVVTQSAPTYQRLNATSATNATPATPPPPILNDQDIDDIIRLGGAGFEWIRRVVKGESAPRTDEAEVEAGRWVAVPRNETRHQKMVRGELSLDEYLIEE